MRNGNIYRNWKTKNDYEFIEIAVPRKLFSGWEDMSNSVAKHADTLEMIKIYFLSAVIFCDSDEYMVLYRTLEKKELWLRNVDDFFGYKEIDIETKVKRFELVGTTQPSQD
jgi:hypothetical protein